MANKVKTETMGAPEKQILIAEDSFKVTLSAVIADTGAVTVNGRKILKAGTPVSGDLKDRNTAFAKETSTPNAVLLHDVDVTDGEENGTIVVAGVVDINKLDTDVQTLITSGVETALTKIIFFKS